MSCPRRSRCVREETPELVVFCLHADCVLLYCPPYLLRHQLHALLHLHDDLHVDVGVESYATALRLAESIVLRVWRGIALLPFQAAADGGRHEVVCGSAGCSERNHVGRSTVCESVTSEKQYKSAIVAIVSWFGRVLAKVQW